jgi:hypothetical protein
MSSVNPEQLKGEGGKVYKKPAGSLHLLDWQAIAYT